MSIWKHQDVDLPPNHNDTANRDVAGNHSKIVPAADSLTAFQVTKTDAATAIINVDSTNGVVTLGDIAGGNTTEIEADGTLKFNGDARVWKDLIMPAGNLRPGATPPAFAAFLGGIYAPRFDAGTRDEVHGSVELQHDYKEGADLLFHVHWSPTTTNTGNIVWGVEYTVANLGTTFPAALVVPGTPVAASGVVNRHQLNNVITIPGAGLKIGAVVVFRLYRQNGGTDTFTGNAFLHSIGIHYECDTTGSRDTTAK